MNDNLKHYGVVGMRWGVRRSSRQLADERFRVSKKQLSAGRDIAKNTSEALRSASNVAGKLGEGNKPSKKVRKELSSMTDQELRTRINRLNMEQQYASLNPSRISRGASAARSTLEVAGNVAAVAGSALSIALAIKTLKNK